MEEKIMCDAAPETAKKLTYEELENTAKELYAQCTNMAAEIQRMTLDNSFKRLDYLFKVLKYYNLLDTEFVRSCAKEIQDVMTIPEDNTVTAE